MNLRPLSPHLQIYRLPLAAIVSISHRIFGGVLFASGIAIALYCLLILSGLDIEWLDALIFSTVAKIKLSALAVVLGFYAAAEMRYILWTLNIGFTPLFVHLSNLLIVTAALVIGIMCWIPMWS